ncbi:MAG TPA: hypothetical protein VM165_07220 [Planctomycetaceae bacterium]|nr:hypothetical protein [Planctomycetaceae bacterium]
MGISIYRDAISLLCRTALCAIAISSCGVGTTVAQQTAKPSEAAADKTPAFLDDARRYVIETLPGHTKLALREQSLLNWTNPVWQQERGAMYVWLNGQRPAAIGSLFTYEYNDTVYSKHELHSLATQPLNATFEGKPAWTPDRPGIVWTDVPDAPPPANAHVGRSLQMRQLARSFRAELIDPKGEKNELRLSPRPLYEYAAPEAGVVDGAILSFVVATDPEVLLLMEAYDESRNGKQTTGYRYALARFHYWQLKVSRGEQLVWEVALDKAHEQNNLGDRENMSKVYNSFHPRRGGATAAEGAKP